MEEPDGPIPKSGRDMYGRPLDPAEHMLDVLFGLYDTLDEAREAQFPDELCDELRKLRLLFMDEFERLHPGRGRGRAVWR